MHRESLSFFDYSLADSERYRGSQQVQQSNYPIRNQPVNDVRNARQFHSSAINPLEPSVSNLARLFQAPIRPHTPEGAREPIQYANNFGADAAIRKKIPRVGPPPVPSGAYLDASQLSFKKITPSVFEPPLLILDLNNTLLVRETRSRAASRRPVVRNYLAAFLQYLCGPAYEIPRAKVAPVVPKTKGGAKKAKKAKKGAKEAPVVVEPVPEVSQEAGRRWRAVVYSSAKRNNVYSMCEAIGLIPHNESSTPARQNPRMPNVDVPFTAGIGDSDPLLLLWSREMMGLTPAEFAQDVETVKDLESVWSVLQGGRWSASTSVLLDDESTKAVRRETLYRCDLVAHTFFLRF